MLWLALTLELISIPSARNDWRRPTLNVRWKPSERFDVHPNKQAGELLNLSIVFSKYKTKEDGLENRDRGEMNLSHRL